MPPPPRAPALPPLTLAQVALTAATDTADLLGSFEQAEAGREAADARAVLAAAAAAALAAAAAVGASEAAEAAAAAWSAFEAAPALALEDEEASRLHAAASAVAAAAQAASPADAAAWASACAREGAAAARRGAPAGLGGAFAWADGPLLRAMEKGHWLLLENANACSPTVLDRLNPLLEGGGRLPLPEAGCAAGGLRVAIAHPAFRLLLSLDPGAGEASRAMRNRGVEVFLLPEAADQARLPPPPSALDRVASIRPPALGRMRGPAKLRAQACRQAAAGLARRAPRAPRARAPAHISPLRRVRTT